MLGIQPRLHSPTVHPLGVHLIEAIVEVLVQLVDVEVQNTSILLMYNFKNSCLTVAMVDVVKDTKNTLGSRPLDSS